MYVNLIIYNDIRIPFVPSIYVGHFNQRMMMSWIDFEIMLTG